MPAEGQVRCLFFLKAGAVEAKRPAILSDSPDDLLRCAFWKVGLNIDRDTDLRAHQPGQLLYHRVGNLARIAYQPARIVQRNRAVETTGAVRSWWWRRWGWGNHARLRSTASIDHWRQR